MLQILIIKPGLQAGFYVLIAYLKNQNSVGSILEHTATFETKNYRDYGIIGEPYFDVDFSKVLYLTDTGRRWDGEKVSVRDKVVKSGQQLTVDSRQFKNTHEIISAAQKGELPELIMFTFHPQRWTNKPFLWVKELVWQNVKNVVKYFLNKIR